VYAHCIKGNLPGHYHRKPDAQPCPGSIQQGNSLHTHTGSGSSDDLATSEVRFRAPPGERRRGTISAGSHGEACERRRAQLVSGQAIKWAGSVGFMRETVSVSKSASQSVRLQGRSFDFDRKLRLLAASPVLLLRKAIVSLSIRFGTFPFSPY
jgi:hypothetical protein